MTSDERIKRLEKWLSELYADAEREMRGKWDKYMERQKERSERLLARVREAKTDEAKKSEEAAYQAHLKSITAGSKYFRDMVNELARGYADAGKRALAIVNSNRFESFAEGYNLSAGRINSVAAARDIGIRFDLCDADTVERLAEHAEDLLLPPKRDPSDLDLAVWNVKNINSQVAQGIVQGESIPHLAERLSRVTAMNAYAAVRTARTMDTNCENAGRVQAMQRAAEWGVRTRKRWLCTHDSRTRDSHLEIDGETVADDATFSNGCRWPGDSAGPAAEVYNCRCTIITVVEGFSSNLPKGKENAVHVTIDGKRVR